MSIIKFPVIVLDISIDDKNKIRRPRYLNTRRCSKIVKVTVKPYEIIVFTLLTWGAVTPTKTSPT